MNTLNRSANGRSHLWAALMFAMLCFIGIALSLQSCQTNLRPETRTMTRELEDSLSVFMQIRNDEEFFRKYIAFNVRFTLRHKMALNDTIIQRELKDELAKMALVQAAQRRIDAIQQQQ
jgi:hypothetical protein